MARPRVHGERVTTAIRFPVATHAELARRADELDVSINWIVNRAVERWLNAVPLPPPSISESEERQ